MLHIGQLVKIADDTPTDFEALTRYRGMMGTIKMLNVIPDKIGKGATALCEFPGILFPEKYLIPIDDDDAFDRFMKKLDLGNPSYSPWLEDA